MPGVPWREIYQRFEPEKPAKLEWRAERPDSPIGRIERLLEQRVSAPKIFLMGAVGGGKSTELLRLTEARRNSEFVVYPDLVRHFEDVVHDGPALHRVNAWELCFLAAVAIWRAAEDQLGLRWDPELGKRLMTAWRRVATATGELSDIDQPGLDISTLAKAMIVQVGAAVGGFVETGVNLVVGALKSPRWTIPLGVASTPLPDQDAALQELLTSVNEIEMEVQRQGRPLLLVIDGLDRVTDPARIKALFIESGLLSHLLCTLVLCGPNLRRSDLMAPQVRRFDIKHLRNEPVLSHEEPGNPDKPGAGIAFFRHVFTKRVQDLEARDALPLPLLDRLAYYSGGQARMFVKLVRSLAQEALLDGVEQATARQVDAALREQRELLEMGLHRGHLELLEQVIADPEHRLPKDDLVWTLLANHQLAPFPNESEWYYPHPLLMLSLLRRSRPGSPA